MDKFSSVFFSADRARRLPDRRHHMTLPPLQAGRFAHIGIAVQRAAAYPVLKTSLSRSSTAGRPSISRDRRSTGQLAP